VASADISKLKIDRSATAQIGSARSRRHRWLKIIFIIALAAAIVFVTLRMIGGKPDVETATVTLIYPSQDVTLLNATGYAVAQRKASLSSKATGRLEWLGVLEGSKVKQGELIARLESGDVSAGLAQSEANVKLAQANLEQGQANLAQGQVELTDAERAFQRSLDLLKQKFIAASSHDAVQARRDKARAAIGGLRAAVSGLQAAIVVAQANRRAAQVALDQTMIRAPFDGVILTKNANVGDNITPFSSAADSKGAVVTIADMDTLEVEADVSESNLAKIRVDQPCEIQFDAYPELRLAGRVSRMVPTIDRSKASLLVKVRFIERDARVLPDMSAKVAFLSKAVTKQQNKPVTAVLATALTTRGGKPVAFVVKGDKVQQVAVGSGVKSGDLVAVTGLKVGDAVVINPDAKLHDGGQVNVVRK
jgi:HlyD family secretion protein